MEIFRIVIIVLGAIKLGEIFAWIFYKLIN